MRGEREVEYTMPETERFFTTPFVAEVPQLGFALFYEKRVEFIFDIREHSESIRFCVLSISFEKPGETSKGFYIAKERGSIDTWKPTSGLQPNYSFTSMDVPTSRIIAKKGDVGAYCKQAIEIGQEVLTVLQRTESFRDWLLYYDKDPQNRDKEIVEAKGSSRTLSDKMKYLVVIRRISLAIKAFEILGLNESE